MDLKDYIDPGLKDSRNTTYTLFGIIDHIGNLDFGHYYSQIKLYNRNIWCEFNDTKIIFIRKNLLDMKKIMAPTLLFCAIEGVLIL